MAKCLTHIGTEGTPPADPQSGTLPDQASPTATDAVTKDTGKPDGKGKPGDGGDGTVSILSGEGETTYDPSREPKEKHPKAESDVFTGAFSYSYPIKLPPGRKGLHPDLELRYSSQDGTMDNLLGYGWSVNIPYIERINRTGVEKLYTANLFTSSLDGELLPTSVSTTTDYRAKVENGDFRTYTFANNQWTVTDKRGTVFKFGTTTGSRQDDVASSTRAYKWMLDEIRDTNNNFITYSYYKDNSQIYPLKITHTGNGSTNGIFETEFIRESRTDVSTSTKQGFNVKTNYRISEIQVKVNGSWVRKYVLLYTTGDNGARSLLQTIRETGRDEATNTTTLPDATLTPRTSPKNWTDDTAWTIPMYFGVSSNDRGVRLVDINSDGLPDLLRAYSQGTDTWYEVALNKGDGTGWATSTSWQIPTGFFFSSSGSNYGTTIVDVNGDALPDLVRAWTASDTKTYLNTGSGWTENSTWAMDMSDDDVNIQLNAMAQLVDVNGDGLVDVVWGRGPTPFGGPDIKNVYINTGSGWTLDANWVLPEYLSEASSDRGVRFADVNGDGLADLLKAYSQGTDQWRKVYINVSST